MPHLHVLVVLDSSANVVERVDYLAYGLARHHFKADINGDGVGPDQSTVSSLTGNSIGGTNYHAEADLDRDGDIDSADVSLASGSSTSLAAGEISSTSVSNDIGWCGYIYDKETGYYCVRNREYMPKAGRWMQRDPLGYADSSNLYGYIGNNPVGWLDPSGLDGFEQQQVFYSFDATAFGSGASHTMEQNGMTWSGTPQVVALFPKLVKLSVTWTGAPEIVGLFHRMTRDEYAASNRFGIVSDWWHWWNSDDTLAVRGRGFMKVLMGIAITAVSVPGAFTPLGAYFTLSGLDMMQSGARQAWTGKYTPTLQHQGLAAIVGEEWATRIEIAIDMVFIAKGILDLIEHAPQIFRAIRLWFQDGCFVAGTLIITSQGPVPIEQVNPGDQVWSFNSDSQEWELCDVQATTEREYDGDIVTLTLESADGACDEVQATGNHPFWVTQGKDLEQRPVVADLPADQSKTQETGRWTEARWLKVGDVFQTRTGKSATVVGLTIRMERVKVYNLKVARLHNYAVGQDGVLVHNPNCLPQDGLVTITVEGERLAGYEIEVHHQLPQEFKSYFEKRGLNIEDYTINIPKDGHRLKPNGLHTVDGGNWNAAWKKFIAENPNATPEEVLEQLKKMRRAVGLEN